MDKLKAKNETLFHELCLERQMNHILNAIRDHSVVLVNACKCGDNRHIVHTLNLLNDFYKSLRQSDMDTRSGKTSAVPKTSHSNGQSVHSCDECKQVFESEIVLKIHTITDHKNLQSFSCHECHEVFTTEDMKTLHLNDIHGTSHTNDTQMNGQSIDSFLNILNLQSLTQKRKSDENSDSVSPKRLRSCRKKRLSANRSTNSGQHSKYFAPQTPKASKPPEQMECDECHKMLASETALEIHTNKYHTKSMPFVCSVCSQDFFANLSLLNHLSQKHKISAFECDECEYKTRTKHHLIQHKVIHSMDRPFACDMKGCYLRFKRKDLLLRHKSVIH